MNVRLWLKVIVEDLTDEEELHNVTIDELVSEALEEIHDEWMAKQDIARNG